MPCPFEIAGRIEAMLPAGSFDGAELKLIHEVLDLAHGLKRRQAGPADALIIEMIRRSGPDHRLFNALLERPRIAWIETMIACHGYAPFARLILPDGEMVHPISALEWYMPDREEFFAIIQLLKPLIDDSQVFLTHAYCAGAYTFGSADLSRLLDLGDITQKALFTSLPLFSGLFPKHPDILERCADAFDVHYRPGSPETGQFLTNALERHRVHIAAAVLAKSQNLPAVNIEDHSVIYIHPWTGAVSRISASGHARLRLINSLGKIGGTRDIFSQETQALEALICAHDPAPVSPRPTPFSVHAI